MKTENKTNHYIDLHAHLDGCITVDIAKKLAALQQITLPAATDEELLSLLSVPDTCENLNDFLKCFVASSHSLITLENRKNISQFQLTADLRYYISAVIQNCHSFYLQ